MTPDDIAEAMTSLEASIEKDIGHAGSIVPAYNGVARRLNIEKMDIRACECGGIDEDMGRGIWFLAQALCAFKSAHRGMIEKAEKAPIPLPQPKSGR